MIIDELLASLVLILQCEQLLLQPVNLLLLHPHQRVKLVLLNFFVSVLGGLVEETGLHLCRVHRRGRPAE